jgi:voltage-gated potassium channel
LHGRIVVARKDRVTSRYLPPRREPGPWRAIRDPEYLFLRRRPALSNWAQFAIRMAIAFALLAVIIGFHWIERDSLRDNIDGHISFADVIYFTMISATTTGYGDIVPVTEQARLFDALIVTPIRIFFLLILAGTAYTFVIKRLWSKWVMQRLQQNLTGHIIVAGYGTSGSEAINELIARGTPPKDIVVVDCEAEAAEAAEALGCNVMQGDATRDATMEAVRIREARALLVSAGRDDTAILVCLTARHLAPDLQITVVVRANDNELPARAAGATTVINPVSFAGLLMAGSAQGLGIADYMADLASSAGRVQLSERAVTAEETGTPLTGISSGLGLRILRGGRSIGFWEEGAKSLQIGDRIIEIVPNNT